MNITGNGKLQKVITTDTRKVKYFSFISSRDGRYGEEGELTCRNSLKSSLDKKRILVNVEAKAYTLLIWNPFVSWFLPGNLGSIPLKLSDM